jgi:hypothetical protein
MHIDSALRFDPATRESGVSSVQARQPLAERVWGLDWSRELPWSFDDATLEMGSFEDALPFMEEHYAGIFGVEHDRFYVEGMTEQKRRFGREMDVFIFRSEGKTIGVVTAHPSDWSTYYVRTFAILPRYRERGWCSDWADRICAPLRAVGCDRWEAECSSANSAMMRLFIGRGMLITSSVNSERWGHMVRFTKFLRPEAEKVFRRQYMNVPAFGRNAQPK